MQLLNSLNLEGEILELNHINIFDQIEVETNNLLYQNYTKFEINKQALLNYVYKQIKKIEKDERSRKAFYKLQDRITIEIINNLSYDESLNEPYETNYNLKNEDNKLKVNFKISSSEEIKLVFESGRLKKEKKIELETNYQTGEDTYLTLNSSSESKNQSVQGSDEQFIISGGNKHILNNDSTDVITENACQLQMNSDQAYDQN